MASPRAFVGLARLAPRSPQHIKNIRLLNSPKTPIKKYQRSSSSLETGSRFNDSFKLSPLNIDTPNRKKILNTELYDCGRNILGTGGFGKVFQASYKGDQVAAKIIRRRKDIDNSVNAEKHATSLKHENIIRILGVDQGPALSMITMELCGKSLHEKLDEGPLSCTERIEIFKAIARALQFCHLAGIVHADIKPRNVLIAADGKPKLADFGSSVLSGEEDLYIGMRGTPGYAAPEVIRGELPSPAADVYSLGILAWQMLSRVLPFAELHTHAILYLTGKGVKPRDTDLDDGLGGKYKKLYGKMWSFEKNQRPGINAVIIELSGLEIEAQR